MRRDDELSLGQGPEARSSRRRGMRAGWVLSILSGTLLMALACSPVQVSSTVEVSGAKKQPTPTPVIRYDSNPQIAEIQRGLEDAYRIRPVLILN